MDAQTRKPVLSPQPWEWKGPRVLIEHSDDARCDTLAAAFRRAGWAVAVCPGPSGPERCPLAGDAGCATAHGADVVVSSLGLGTPEAREALAALRAQLPRTPLLVEADADDVARWPELVDGCDVVAATATPEQLVERVQAAFERKAADAA